MTFFLVEAGFGSYNEIMDTELEITIDMFEFMQIRKAQEIAIQEEHQRNMRDGRK